VVATVFAMIRSPEKLTEDILPVCPVCPQTASYALLRLHNDPMSYLMKESLLARVSSADEGFVKVDPFLVVVTGRGAARPVIW